MEISLARNGHKVWLSGTDIEQSIRSLSKRPLEDGGFFASELFHVIDFVGVKANRTVNGTAKAGKPEQRYVARSFPLASIKELPAQLALGRPVIAGLQVQDTWFKRPILTTGTIDVDARSHSAGGVLGALVGWDPSLQLAKVMTPWPTWGKSGLGTMTRAALEKYVEPDNLRAVEPTLMAPSPFAAP
jgi:hypothetical protein